MRVTQSMLSRQTLNDLNYQIQGVLKLQEQLSTGLRVNSPSDDPLSARRAVNIRSTMARYNQYLSNMKNASPQLTETDSTLQTVINSIIRAKGLTEQGSNGTNSQTQRDEIAVEINQILEGVVSEANHQTNGRYIFGGTRSTEAPFTITRDSSGNITNVTYNGNEEDIAIPVADGSEITINENGKSAFTEQQDLFKTLINIRDELKSGNLTNMQTRLSELDSARNQTLNAMARVGAAQNRIEQLTKDFENYVTTLKATLSDNIDADYAQTVINLDAQSNAFQAALNATGRIIQPSLLDFLS